MEAQLAVAEQDAPAAIARVERVSRVMDDAFRVPGTRFRIGLDPILGIVPGAGDSIASLISMYIVFEAVLAGVSSSTLLRMLFYLAVDTLVGSIPLVGTIFDAFWKANRWNARLLAEELNSP